MIGCHEAEAAVLGCFLHAGLRSSAQMLEVEDFTDPRHRAVFSAIVTVQKTGNSADPVTVLGELRRSGLERSMTCDRDAGVFLSDLLAAAPTIGAVGVYVGILIEHRVRREMVRLAERMTQVAESADLDTCRQVIREDITALAVQVGRLNARQVAA